MKHLKHLTYEQQLTILTCRVTISEEIAAEIKLLIKDINWFDFVKYTFYHKSFALSIHNIITICPNAFIPKYIYELFDYVRYCTRIRNQLYFEESVKIINKLAEKSVQVIPVKGTYLVPHIYNNDGLRFSGDIDMLVKYEHIGTVDLLMKENGYIKGEFNPTTKEINPVNKIEDMKWKMYMSNIHPYYKRLESEFIFYYKLDFRYALDDSLSKDSINEIIDYFTREKVIPPEYYYIHLCTHFYDEAHHDITIDMCKSFNLIKLCDIREFGLKAMNKHAYHNLINFAQKHNLINALYYTLFFLHYIYNDSYEEELLEILQNNNPSIHSLNNVKVTFPWENLFICK